MKIGIDVHGVLDDNPFFKEMSKLFVEGGHEVHIITGSQHNKILRTSLEKMGIKEGLHYTHLFSISDHLIAKGIPVRWEGNNNPYFDGDTWNEAKAEYCKERNIDIHFDDSKEYAGYFSTPFYLKQK
jgi:hypothetical protein